MSKLAENKVDIIGILNSSDGMEHVAILCNTDDDFISIRVTDIIDILNSQKAEIENLNIALKVMRGTANTYKRECKRLENEVERLDYMLEEVSK